MDDDDILIEVKLDDREIVKQMDAIGRKLQKSLDVALGGKASGGGSTAATRAIKDQETAALKLAQAQARLATASGDLGKAQMTLSTALANTNKQTVASIGAQTQLVQVQNRMTRALQDTAAALTSVGSKLTLGVTAPLGALAVAAIKTATDFDSLKRGLVSVSGSSAEAEKQLVRLKEVAKLPGLGFKEAIQGSINLQAAGFSAERAERSLKAFGNALATVGKGKTELQGVILALSQIESKGKVSAEEINQLAERVPQIRKAMIAAFGTADTEVIQKAKITSKQFIDAVVTELEKLPKVTGGARNTFENLKDSIEQSLLPLGNKLLETILPAIEKLTPKILGLLEGFSKLSPEVQTLAIGFGVAAIAAGPLIGALGNILTLVTQIRNLGGIGSVLGFGGAGLGFVAAPAAAASLGVGLSALELARRERQLEAARENRFNPRDFEGKPLFTQIDRSKITPLTGPIKLGTSTLGLDPATGRSATGAPSPADAPIIDAKKLAAENAKRQGQKSELDKAREHVKQLTEKVAALGNQESALGVELAKIDVLRAKLELGQKARDDARFKEAKRQLGIPLAPELPGGIGLPTLTLSARGGVAGLPAGPALPTTTAEDALTAARSRGDLADARLRIQETQIQSQINRGILTEAQAQQQLAAARRASRGELIASLEAQLKVVDTNSIEGLQIQEQIERVRFLGVELSNTEHFMRGFANATESVGDAFERFGQNVARALTNTKDLLNGLKQSVLQLFNDLLGNSLQNLVRGVLGPILGGLGGASASAGAAGGIFRTPSTFPAAIAQAFAGSQLSLPPALSSGPLGFGLGFGVPGLGGASGARATASGIDQVLSGAGSVFGGAPASVLSTGKFNFGQIGQNLAGLAPLLGLSIGASLGGQSRAGNILGAAGGLLTSTFISTTLGAPGALGSLAPALFSNPITAIAGAGLLVGAVLLGKASQRKKDEEASGQFLTQALQGIEQLAAGVASGQIEGSQARSIFDTQILGTFRQQISGLKTKSVVQSRLTNQVRDLENVYNARIPPLIADRERQARDAARFAAIDSRLIPQFAVGGMSAGGLAILHPDEMVLTPGHQVAVRAIAGPDIFERVGVPGVNTSGSFDAGGIAPPSFGQPQIVIQNLTIEAGIVASEEEARRMTRIGLSGRDGENLIVDKVNVVRKRKRIS